MNRSEINTYINTALADGSGISAAVHREVEFAILNYIDDKVGTNALPLTPVTFAASNNNTTSFRANFSGVSGATSYRFDVSISPSFNSFVTGYENYAVTDGSTSILVSSLIPGTNYYYRVRAINSAGVSGNSNVTSALTEASGSSNIAASISTQPTNHTINEGSALSFTVVASGTATITYQWQKLISGTWTNISGATSATYTISGATTANSGQYRVQVQNSYGSVTSDIVTGTVNVVAIVCVQYYNNSTGTVTINYTNTSDVAVTGATVTPGAAVSAKEGTITGAGAGSMVVLGPCNTKALLVFGVKDTAGAPTEAEIMAVVSGQKSIVDLAATSVSCDFTFNDTPKWLWVAEYKTQPVRNEYDWDAGGSANEGEIGGDPDTTPNLMGDPIELTTFRVYVTVSDTFNEDFPIILKTV